VYAPLEIKRNKLLAKGSVAMYNQTPQTVDQVTTFPTMPFGIAIQIDSEFEKLAADLSPEKPWMVRKATALKLGKLGSQAALDVLIDALPHDPFWKVRCAIIVALECIGDEKSLSTLKDVANSDSMQIVRSYAEKAIENIS
jgi:hypothetical protein